MTIPCEFCFHSVGQGLFYSGRIGSFNFVYDCGGELKLCKQEIALLPKEKLDLLIISHLHHDHTKGIRALLEHCGGVKQVLLPAMTKEEIFLIAAEYLASGVKRSRGDKFLILLQKPEDFFPKDTKIVRITSSGGEDRRRPEERSGNDDSRDSSGRTHFEWEDGKGNPSPDKAERDHHDRLGTNFWRFAFYHEPMSKEVIAKGREIFEEDMEKSIEELEPEVLVSKIKEFKKFLVEKKEDFNLSSLMCLHGPREPWIFSSAHHMPIECFRCITCEHKLRGTTLLTGDANFQKGWSGFMKHYSDEDRRSVGYALVPHHGSKDSWSRNLFMALPYCRVWICSYGRKNKDGHIHPEVLFDFSFWKIGRFLYPCVDGMPSFRYGGKFPIL